MAMTWLALDTSTDWLSAAVWTPKRVLSEKTVLLGRGMLQKTPVIVQTMLRASEVGIHGITGLAVGIGPGSYTGLRVGLSFMQGLALARSAPLHGVKTPAVIAAAFPGRDRVCIMQESGRRTGHIIVSVYDTMILPPKELTAPTIILPTELTATVDLHDTVVVGPAAARVAAFRGGAFANDEITEEKAGIPRGSLLAELAHHHHQAGDPGDPRLVDGVYLTFPPVPRQKRTKV
jgi:tRNA threonylcarbamoyladenosine biosynthesis protein TsaB